MQVSTADTLPLIFSNHVQSRQLKEGHLKYSHACIWLWQVERGRWRCQSIVSTALSLSSLSKGLEQYQAGRLGWRWWLPHYRAELKNLDYRKMTSTPILHAPLHHTNVLYILTMVNFKPSQPIIPRADYYDLITMRLDSQYLHLYSVLRTYLGGARPLPGRRRP